MVWDDLIDKLVHGVELQVVEHDSGGPVAVANVSVDKLVGRLQVVRNLIVFHDVDLLVEHLLGDEHLVVHLQLRHVLRGRD